jgi:hypothetical protein
MQLKLDEYSEIATTLQIFDKDFLYICAALAKSVDDISDLTSLVEVLISKKGKEELFDYLILKGKEDLQSMSSHINYTESWGSPRDAVKLNFKDIDSLNTNNTLKLLISAAQTRNLILKQRQTEEINSDVKASPHFLKIARIKIPQKD